MKNNELADLYLEAAMRYEDEQYVECGFKKASEYRGLIYENIKKGTITSKQLKFIAPVFDYVGINIYEYIQPRKRFLFF